MSRSVIILCFIIFVVSADVGLSVHRHKRQYVSNIRLRDGLTYKGRVEVYHNDRWGTICDTLWDDDDAKVVCRHLGFNGSAIALTQPHFGPGNGPVHMSDVECIGTEYDLSMCSFSGWDNLASGCSDHSKDAGVDCRATFIGQPALQWKHEQTYDLTHVRLVGQHDVSVDEGRVEVYHDGKWGSICDDGWNDDNAGVVCRMLGYTSGVARHMTRTSNSRERKMVGVQCLGTEDDIAKCTFAGWGYQTCSSGYDAGALCGPTTSKWTHENSSTSSHVRIVGDNPYDGQVEVFHDGSWGSVCFDDWDNDDATVFCKMLGFPVGEAKNLPRKSDIIKVSGLQCIGTETDIVLCNSNGFGRHQCSSSYVAGVKCGTDTSVAWSHEESPLAFTNIRIVGGKMAGRVEVFHNSSWGTICDDYWDDDDASVICRMLGFSPYGARAESNAYFGQGKGAIHMDDMQCIGSEEDISLCDFHGWDVNNCGHTEDAGVRCQPKNTKAVSWSHEVPPALRHIRLVGSVPNEGLVEIFNNGEWGTICNTGWDFKDAMVVCGMLGFPRTGANVLTPATKGPAKIHMTNVTCKGTESDISLCDFNGWGNTRACNHLEIAGVQCKSTGIKLSSTYQGTVQIFVNGAWGTICDDSWDEKDAEVVCRVLNLHPVRAYGITSAYFGRGNGPVHMNHVNCQGNEVDISLCKNTVSPTCSHDKDAGVHCSPVDIRLADGNSYSGRVEVLYNGEWGTICDDSWDVLDARVVCKMLGLPTSHVYAFRSAHFGEGSGPVLMNNVRCTADESDISVCSFDGWKNNTCRHNKDASVYCSSSDVIARLADGQTPNQGRVEILHNSTWGTICDDNWDERDASVICRMLGYSPFGVKSFSNSHFGRGGARIPVHLDNVGCIGNETSILQCASNDWNKHDCSHGEDAGVYCPVDTTQVRLAGTDSPYSGLVQVYHDGEWGYICADHWDTYDARVVCRMLNYPVSGALPYNERKTSQNQGPIKMANVQCTGLEMDISSCGFDGWSNIYSIYRTNCALAGVNCKTDTGYGNFVG